MDYLENCVEVDWWFDWVTKEMVPGLQSILLDLQDVKVVWAGEKKT